LNLEKNPYEFKGNTLYYSKDRGEVDYDIIFNREEENITIYNVSFFSRDFLTYKTKIY
jgi:hypothetical protein